MKTNHFLLAAGVSLALAFTFSCSSDGGSKLEEHTFVDIRDNKTYAYVVIGSQTWMAENLNHAVAGSKCYGGDGEVYGGLNEEAYERIYITLSAAEVRANCAKYGRLYDWATAMNIASTYNGSSYPVSGKHQGVCPNNWHIPSDDEWATLINYVESQGGCTYCAGNYLKAKTGWNAYEGISGNGLDTYGFSALPGGDGNSYGYFNDAGDYGNWWSSSEYEIDSDAAYGLFMGYDYEDAARSFGYKTLLLSVRCVQDW
ncbi:MAG: fibrobacter succinogenes major paralogous domain-containing protein [Fibromonadales bacterium]|nr:fibrobacter succinogenes major paralogous domain-containing protein [Fibromonadales bacterium]